jgi:ABC-2 type transport system permease protein
MALGFMVLLPVIIWSPSRSVGRQRQQRPEGGGAFGSLVDLATSGGLNFALFCLAVSAGFLLVVVVALFCGDPVASEASWGSLRYLLAIPVPRVRLLAVKLVVALAYSLLALLILTATGLLVGTLRYWLAPLGSTVAAAIPPARGVAAARVVGYLA